MYPIQRGMQILVPILCMLAQSRNERANEMQLTMGIYLRACGASRTQIDVLNHMGISVSYTTAIRRLKDLSEERLALTRACVRSRACMIEWDNVNFSFEVSEQRKDSKTHFDSGTTAILVPLHGVAYGSLPLSLLPVRQERLPVLHFTSDHIYLGLDALRELEEAMLWDVEDILFNAIPELRARFKDSIAPPRAIRPIPLHQTEQFPLPAMHIDESSLDGTAEVLETILTRHLGLTAEDIERHGIFICAGDQLTISLLDKV